MQYLCLQNSFPALQGPRVVPAGVCCSSALAWFFLFSSSHFFAFAPPSLPFRFLLDLEARIATVKGEGLIQLATGETPDQKNDP